MADPADEENALAVDAVTCMETSGSLRQQSFSFCVITVFKSATVEPSALISPISGMEMVPSGPDVLACP